MLKLWLHKNLDVLKRQCSHLFKLSRPWHQNALFCAIFKTVLCHSYQGLKLWHLMSICLSLLWRIVRCVQANLDGLLGHMFTVIAKERHTPCFHIMTLTSSSVKLSKLFSLANKHFVTQRMFHVQAVSVEMSPQNFWQMLMRSHWSETRANCPKLKLIAIRFNSGPDNIVIQHFVKSLTSSANCKPNGNDFVHCLRQFISRWLGLIWSVNRGTSATCQLSPSAWLDVMQECSGWFKTSGHHFPCVRCKEFGLAGWPATGTSPPTLCHANCLKNPQCDLVTLLHEWILTLHGVIERKEHFRDGNS